MRGKHMIHWGPITTFIAIAFMTFITFYAGIILNYHPTTSFNYFNLIIYVIWNILIVTSFIRATSGPGYVPLQYRPSVSREEEYLQFCKLCNGFIPPRAHHCNVCKRCVLRMDHHCPWINSCVGHKNVANFSRFLLFVSIALIHAILSLIKMLYIYTSKEFFLYPSVLPIYPWYIITVFGAIMLGTSLLVFTIVLGISQLKGILQNQTYVETVVMDRALEIRTNNRNLPVIENPYNLGYKENFDQVFALKSNTEEFEGYIWNVRQGHNPFTLTLEAKFQHKFKWDNSVKCLVRKPYGQSYCGSMKFGCIAWLCGPWFYGNRMAVKKNDIVKALVHNSHWCYAVKLECNEMTNLKGYLPIDCLEQCVEVQKKKK